MTPGLIQALNHRTRRQILRRLAGRGACLSPAEVSRDTGKHLSGVSYHFRVLAKHGAVEEVDSEPARGSLEHFFVSLVARNTQVKAILAATKAADEQG